MMLIFDVCSMKDRACDILEGELLVWVTNELCILYDQNSSYNEMVYISPGPLFSPLILCFD